MKFKIRYADQIVGFFSIAAIVGLIALIFSIGARQDWFKKKYKFYTMFDSASGISVGMNVQYKGFTIGKIEAVTLEDKRARVDFYLLDDYKRYALANSLVQFSSSPIGLGSSFNFLPGSGPMHIEEGSEIYSFDSYQGKQILGTWKNHTQDQGDSISLLMGNINGLLTQIRSGLEGKDDSPLSLIMDSVAKILVDLEEVVGSIRSIDDLVPRLLGGKLNNEIEGIVRQLRGAVKSIDGLVNGNVTSILGTAEDLIGGDVKDIIGSTGEIIDTNVKQLLKELDMTMLQVEDVLIGLKNNPLLRNGVPDRSQATPGTFHVRDEDF